MKPFDEETLARSKATRAERISCAADAQKLVETAHPRPSGC